MDLFWPMLIGFGVGISGTIPGGLWIYRMANTLPKQSGLVSFSGGIMTAIVLFDLGPESLYIGGVVPAGAGMILGGCLMYLFDVFDPVRLRRQKRPSSKATQIGLLMGVGIASHNFPEGIALGALVAANPDPKAWLGLAWLLGIHNIPEGMVMASALKLGKVGLLRSMAALVVVEIPMALGSLVGAALGRISGWMSGLALGFASGAMLFLVFKGLLPLARKMAGIFWTGLGFLIGFCLGIVLTALL